MHANSHEPYFRIQFIFLLPRTSWEGVLKLPGKNFADPQNIYVRTDSLGWKKVVIERLVMTEKHPKDDPDYGVRLTGEELAEHQQKFQQPRADAASEYGPQGTSGQYNASEYGPQGGQQPGQQYPGFQPPSAQPGYQQPGYQQPGYQQPGYQQPGYQQPPGFGGPQLHPDMAKEPERPQTVNIAFWSIIAAGIAHLITQLIVLSLPNRGLSEQEIQLFEQEFGGFLEQAPFDDFATMLNSSMVTASMTVLAVITLVIYILVALGIRHGWRSMRVIGTIFAVFSLLSFSFVSPLAAVFSVGSVILGIVGIVYAWLPASTEYFRRKAWQKAAKQAYPDMPLR